MNDFEILRKLIKCLSRKQKIIILVVTALILAVVTTIIAVKVNSSSKFIKANSNAEIPKFSRSSDKTKDKNDTDNIINEKTSPSPSSSASSSPKASAPAKTKAPTSGTQSQSSSSKSSQSSSQATGNEAIVDINAENNDITYSKITVTDEESGNKFSIPDCFTEDTQNVFPGTKNYYAGDDFNSSPVFLSMAFLDSEEWDAQKAIVNQYIDQARSLGDEASSNTIKYKNGSMPAVLTYDISDDVISCEFDTRATPESIKEDYPDISSAPEGSKNYLSHYENSGYMIKCIKDRDTVKVINISYNAANCRTSDGLCDINTFNSYINAAKQAFDEFK